MSSDDQETATVHDAKSENMTASTASSRSEVLILLSLQRRTGEFSEHRADPNLNRAKLLLQ